MSEIDFNFIDFSFLRLLYFLYSSTVFPKVALLISLVSIA